MTGSDTTRVTLCCGRSQAGCRSLCVSPIPSPVWGGDEFTVIMEGLPRPEVASTIAAKIVQAMSTPFFIGQQAINVTASIGLAFYQGDATTVEALVQQADLMLYQAKDAGHNNVQVALRLIEGGRA